MTEEVKTDYPMVNVELRFHEDGLWFNTYIPIGQYWAILKTGVADEFTAYEIKVKEWVPEEDEFKYCYMAYNPIAKSWRIGYDA